MGILYVISGVTGMTGNELVKQLLEDGKKAITFWALTIFLPLLLRQ